MSDINNLPLVDEPLGDFNPDAELYRNPAPPPDGTYSVRLEQKKAYGGEEYWRQYADKETQAPYFATQLSGFIQDPSGAYDNRLVFADFVSTKVMEGGSSAVAQVIKALGFGDGLAACRTHKDIMELFEQALSSQRPIKAAIQWQARGWDKEARAETCNVRGMKKFPQNPDGTYNPVITDSDGIPLAEAKAVITRFLPLETGYASPASA
jgi:hypothetical protein